MTTPGSLRSRGTGGLIVDFGGVLTTNVFQSFKQFAEAEGLPPDTVKKAFRDDPEALALLRKLEKNEITHEEFEAPFAERIGVPPDRAEGLVGRLFAGVGPDERMLDAVRAARGAGVRTGLISNSWGEGLPYDKDLLGELFDGVVISGDEGLHKPQREIYELGCKRVGLPPADCVFVDDLRENCEGAEAVGMTAVLHRGAERTLPRLEELLGVELR
jgi:epoxide hydrolase-like predicted phosphatase